MTTDGDGSTSWVKQPKHLQHSMKTPGFDATKTFSIPAWLEKVFFFSLFLSTLTSHICLHFLNHPLFHHVSSVQYVPRDEMSLCMFQIRAHFPIMFTRKRHFHLTKLSPPSDSYLIFQHVFIPPKYPSLFNCADVWWISSIHKSVVRSETSPLHMMSPLWFISSVSSDVSNIQHVPFSCQRMIPSDISVCRNLLDFW